MEILRNIRSQSREYRSITSGRNQNKLRNRWRDCDASAGRKKTQGQPEHKVKSGVGGQQSDEVPARVVEKWLQPKGNISIPTPISY
jgi:hypothetical protein